MRGTPSRFPIGKIETPPPGEAVAPGPLRVAGWALATDGPLREAIVLVDGRTATPAHLGWAREDIAAQHSEVPDAGLAGWEAEVDLRRVAGSTATISLLARAAGGSWDEVHRTALPIERSALGAGRRDRAAFTVVQNESIFLPLWLSYYGRHFDPDDIYVLDHDSTDGSTAALEGACRVVPIHREKSFDHTWLRATVEEFQSFLLSSYQWVLFAEADEFVVPDPSVHDGLGSYIGSVEGGTARCSGYNVVHYPGEPRLDLNRPILDQRRYWHPSDRYSKRALGAIPLAWSTGFHREANGPAVPPDPDLYLIHLHRVDHELCLERHRAAAARNWNEADVRDGLGPQNRIVDPEEFQAWFLDADELEGPRESIPDVVRRVL